jgi:hypothetical protein
MLEVFGLGDTTFRGSKLNRKAVSRTCSYPLISLSVQLLTRGGMAGKNRKKKTGGGAKMNHICSPEWMC